MRCNSSVEALKFYQGIGYGDINRFLRSSQVVIDQKFIHDHRVKEEPILECVGNIDSIMSNTGSLRGISIYRGIHSKIIPNAWEGTKIIRDLSYSSCTKNLRIAQESFTNTDGCCILVFQVPDMVKYYEYEYKSYSEEEVLLERGIKYNLIDRHDNIYTCTIEKYEPDFTLERELTTMIAQQAERLRLTPFDELVRRYIEDGMSEEDAIMLAELDS